MDPQGRTIPGFPRSVGPNDCRWLSATGAAWACAAALVAAPIPANQADPAGTSGPPRGTGAWRSYEPVQRPSLPEAAPAWALNPIDRFIAAEHARLGLKPRPGAVPEVLLRRVYIDLIGLNPTPEEQRAFLSDAAPDAYERLVDQLLEDPRYGERWARHWMDVWRYSDWAGWSGGNQIRDSKPHIWRWRDWIVESLNQDKGYDRMLTEMLAADELCPEDADALRATGYLVRNYKMLSREQWIEDTVKHAAQAFLGVTMGCAKCHDHKADPIPQEDYYRWRAIFEPHWVRTDRVPGELDIAKNGLVRVYDTNTNPPTYLFLRGDERQPETNRLTAPGVPRAFANASDPSELTIRSIDLPRLAAFPDRRPFVIRDAIAAAESHLANRQAHLDRLNESDPPESDARLEAALEVELASAQWNALLATVKAERIEDDGRRETPEWSDAAREAVRTQRVQSLAEKRLSLARAKTKESTARRKAEEAAAARDSADREDSTFEGKEKEAAQAAEALVKITEAAQAAEKEFAEAESVLQSELNTDYRPRPQETFPQASTGRRLALARWMVDPSNPRTARVAANHIWLRHFGRGLASTPTDFGLSGAAPSHPALLDWLAAELMEHRWSLKWIHRVIVTSRTYRMASTPDESNLSADPDNTFLWRIPPRRMEAELVRDNLLWVTGRLDGEMGGPDIDHERGLVSRRRSIYLRIAAEKEVEFLKVFDGPSVTECYERHTTVMPQQALAMSNNLLAAEAARDLSGALAAICGEADGRFVDEAFARLLAREPIHEERRLALEFLEGGRERFRERLIRVLFNHHEFVTIR